jgi:hypothetical protein
MLQSGTTFVTPTSDDMLNVRRGFSGLAQCLTDTYAQISN